MQYRLDKKGRPISVLGYGCLRFTKQGKQIDLLKAEEEILKGIQMGINYFDTAYTYGGSEKALGEILERNGMREKVSIATKLPGYLLTRPDALDRYLKEQLQRLRTDHIDYYLMHMLTDRLAWEKLCGLGIEDWIRRKKEEGILGAVGFSFHGDTSTFISLVDAYDWDLCQIQYNYVDEHTQAGRRGLLYASQKGLPVIIMEPLRGGRLVSQIPEEARALMAESGRGFTPAQLGLWWLYDQPEVTCVLSGMNSLSMVEENCELADRALAGSFTEEDRELVEKVRELIVSHTKVPCTGCAYCMPCPHGVDIPQTFRSYNGAFLEGKSRARFEYCRNVGLRERDATPRSCVGCGLCEKHCPQGIEIRRELKEARKVLMPLPYAVGTALARKVALSRKRGQ